MSSPGGKGSTQRPTDAKKFSDGYDLIFGKKKTQIEYLADAKKAKLNGQTYEQWAEAAGYIDTTTDEPLPREGVKSLWKVLPCPRNKKRGQP